MTVTDFIELSPDLSSTKKQVRECLFRHLFLCSATTGGHNLALESRGKNQDCRQNNKTAATE